MGNILGENFCQSKLCFPPPSQTGPGQRRVLAPTSSGSPSHPSIPDRCCLAAPMGFPGATSLSSALDKRVLGAAPSSRGRRQASLTIALKLPGVTANLMAKIEPPKAPAALLLAGCVSHGESCLLVRPGHGLLGCNFPVVISKITYFRFLRCLQIGQHLKT